jgi:hypothetical protein
MPAFRVEKTYMVPHRDLIVLAGVIESGTVKPGWSIDLPKEIKGPGWVPIHDVQKVAFQDGKERLCVILQWELLTGAPLMEFTHLEGLALDVRAV